MAISIHAPREGRDGETTASDGDFPYFNPRAPRGARRGRTEELTMEDKFQSTRPARGATGQNGGIDHGGQISIHAPREGRDHVALAVHRVLHGISIHAPREGRDVYGLTICTGYRDFNPRAPRGARRTFVSYRRHLF